MRKMVTTLGAIGVGVLWSTAAFGFIVGHQHTDLSAIPDSWIAQAKADLHIAYNHTSHGSQIITGIDALEDYGPFGGKYEWSDTTQGDSSSLSLDDDGIPGVADLSQGDEDADGDGILNWAEDTYTYLNNEWNNYQNDPDHQFVNVIMWSWCNISTHFERPVTENERYIRSMEWLIAQFSAGGSIYTDDIMINSPSPHSRADLHPVKFVFMTAHANGGGEGDTSDEPNELIRNHCETWNRILFDFSDIENYDPDGNYYLDKSLWDDLDYNDTAYRDANWASEYLDRHEGEELFLLTKGDPDLGVSPCGSCSHSDSEGGDARLNCVLKGSAAWHLFARLAGWEGVDSAHAVTGLQILSGAAPDVATGMHGDKDAVITMGDVFYLLRNARQQ